MANFKTYDVTVGSLLSGSVICKNPTIELLSSDNVEFNCIDEVNGIYRVQVADDAELPCLRFKVTCDDGDCVECQDEIEKCFCDTTDDCPDCHECNNGFCDKLCDPEDCVDGQCVECESAADCSCNQVCNNGACECPPGTTEQPDGCCDECQSNADCDDCDVCTEINGSKECIPKECSEGALDPSTCGCVECLQTSDCTGANECCRGKECKCCPGYIRVNGVCIPYECTEDDQCDSCENCKDYKCEPVQCPDGQQCDPNTGDCRDSCPCDPGEGCLDGVCVDCETLSCTGSPSPCVRAEGCDCDGDNCTSVDCETSKNCAEWEAVPAQFIPGDAGSDPGLPAIVFTHDITQLDIVQIGGGDGAFLDYQITVSAAGGETGAWAVNGGYATNGSSITFTLSEAGPVQWNNVGFEVTFIEDGATGRTGSIVIYNDNYNNIDPTNLGGIATLMTDPATWVVDVQSTPVAPGSGNGTTIPGSLKLCACNPNTEIVSYTWTTTEGNLTVKVYPTAGQQCSPAVIQGCGAGEGTVTLDCAGKRVTIPIPELPYDYSSSACCDPIANPDCTGEGDPGQGCTDLSVVTGSILLTPYDYSNGSNGVYLAVIQEVPSLGLTYPAIIRNKRPFCWSVTGAASFYTGDGTFTPPVFDSLFKAVQFGGGSGCVRLGYTCDIPFAGCKKLQAETCFEGCTDFSVTLIKDGDDLTAVPSFGGANVTYTWTSNDGTLNSELGKTVTLPNPNLTITNVTVTASLTVNGETCQDTAVLGLIAIVPPDISTPTYECDGGLKFHDDGANVTYRNALNNVLNEGARINEDLGYQITATTDVSTEEFSIIIPPCYSCPSCAKDVNGIYESVNECNEACPNCDAVFDVDIAFTCQDQAAKVIITVNDGSGDYDYSVSSNGVNFDQGEFSGSSKTITGIPQGDITVNVADQANGCDADDSQTVSNCITCIPNDGTVVISNVDTSDVCTGLLSYQVSSQTPSPYPFTVTIEEVGSDTVIATSTVNSGVNGSFSGLTLNNTSYDIIARDANGCEANTTIVVACTSAVCDGYDVDIDWSSPPSVSGSDVNFAITWTSASNLPSGGGSPVIIVEYQDSPAACNNPGATWLQTTLAASDVPGNPGMMYLSGSSGSVIGTVAGGASLTGCYRARIQFTVGVDNCDITSSIPFYGQTAAPENCEICLDMPASPCNDVSWADDELTITWCFDQPPTSFNINITDPQGTTTFSDGSTTKVITSSTNLSEGTLALDSPGSAVGRNVTVEFDTGQSACDYSCIIAVPACTCAINSPAADPIVTYIEDSGQLIVEFDVVCGSGEYDVTLDVYPNGTCTPASVTTVETVTADPGTQTGLQAVFSVPATGSDQSYEVLIEDTTVGGCTRSVPCQVIDACTVCTAQTFPGFADRIATQVPQTQLLSITASTPAGTHTFTGSKFVNCGVTAAVNDALAADLETFLDGIDPCGGSSTVSWAQNDFTGSGGTALSAGDCLSYNEIFAGTGSDVVWLEDLVFASGTISVDQNVATYSGGTPTLVAGAAQAIADALAAQLDADLFAFSEVLVQLKIVNTDEVQVVWNITGIDTAVSIDTIAGIVGSETTVAETAACDTIGAAGQANVALSEFGCVTFTVEDTGVFITTVNYNGIMGSVNVDDSGC